MKRTKPVTSQFEPALYKIVQDHEENVSSYIHDLVIADLIRRELLTISDVRDMNDDEGYLNRIEQALGAA